MDHLRRRRLSLTIAIATRSLQQRDAIARDELVTLLRSTIAEVETTLRALDPATVLERRKIQGHDVDDPRSHLPRNRTLLDATGQIIMLTKMLTATDLRFYEFDDGVPVQTWRSDSSD